jgi:hypothetical protein
VLSTGVILSGLVFVIAMFVLEAWEVELLVVLHFISRDNVCDKVILP